MTLATAKTLDRIVGYISEYWGSRDYTLVAQEEGVWGIVGPRGLKDSHNVICYRGGYKFQSLAK